MVRWLSPPLPSHGEIRIAATARPQWGETQLHLSALSESDAASVPHFLAAWMIIPLSRWLVTIVSSPIYQ